MIRAAAALIAAVGMAGCASPEAACPATFDAFLERFMADPDYQMQAVADPLIESALAPTLDEGIVETPRPRRELKPPLMMSRETLREERLMLRVEAEGAKPRVVVHTPDGDAFQTVYTFEKRGCWVLTRMDDQSL